MSDKIHVYSDAGLLSPGLSPLGGSFAWNIVRGGRPGFNPCEGKVLKAGSGLYLAKTVAPPIEVESYADNCEFDFIEINLMELYSAYQGLKAAKEMGFMEVVICCDNKNALGRLCENYAMNNVPQWLIDESKILVGSFLSVEPVLINGHPNKAQLKSGIGSRGYVTSEHNVWADRECKRLCKIFKNDLS